MIWKKLIPRRYETFQKVLQLSIRNLSTSNSLRQDHYEVLGIRKDATLAEIKNAYFELSKIYHPDRIAATDENLSKFRAISDAYEVLGNEQARKLYDRGLLRESGKLETVSEDDLSDPIIKFYRERQKRERELKKQDEWTTQYYKEAREAAIEKNEFYKYTAKEEEYVDGKHSHLFILICAGLLSVYTATYVENSKANENWNKFVNWVSSTFG